LVQRGLPGFLPTLLLNAIMLALGGGAYLLEEHAAAAETRAIQLFNTRLRTMVDVAAHAPVPPAQPIETGTAHHVSLSLVDSTGCIQLGTLQQEVDLVAGSSSLPTMGQVSVEPLGEDQRHITLVLNGQTTTLDVSSAECADVERVLARMVGCANGANGCALSAR
jgi:hypothetical protein